MLLALARREIAGTGIGVQVEARPLLRGEGRNLGPGLLLGDRAPRQLEDEINTLRAQRVVERSPQTDQLKAALVRVEHRLRTGRKQDLVTLDQAAAMVSRSKRTLEKYKSKESFPRPAVEGGGGKPDFWHWTDMRRWLEGEFDVELPEKHPANRPRS
jgi:hypothetical protein